MGLDVWFREDIVRALRSVSQAGRALYADKNSEEQALILRGFDSAILAIAAAYGISESEIWRDQVETKVIRRISATTPAYNTIS